MRVSAKKYPLTNAIIPKEIFKSLPFKEENINSWNEKTDLLKFLVMLFSGTGYESYGDYSYDTGIEHYKSLAIIFESNAKNVQPAPGSKTQNVKVLDFLHSGKYGLLSKYMIAWDGIVQSMLSENAFFSIIHILEGQMDLRCSVQLASNLYYKQAFQILRSFIENNILQVHFCDNLTDFSNWKNNSYHTPALRGKKGLLSQLLDKKLITKKISIETANLYGDLNGYIHGSVDKLLNKGIYKGKWEGYLFKEKDFNLYTNYLIRTIRNAIEITRISLAQWEKNYAGKIICSVCHSVDFKIRKNMHNEKNLNQYTCKTCGNKALYKTA